MELHVELSRAIATLDLLRQSCEPSRVSSWRPSEQARQLYIDRCEDILAALARMKLHQARQVFIQGQVQDYLPGPLLRDLAQVLAPIEPDIWTALNVLDPTGEPFRAILYGPTVWPSGNKIWSTFDQGIEQVRQLIDRNPGDDFEDTFSPDQAGELLESRLIQFDPDAWTERALSLAPVRVGRVNLILPGNLRLRLEEIYRTYVFGCWISVIGLSRAALEYALLDNANRLGIATTWPPDRDGRVRAKRLIDLSDDYGDIIPTISLDLKTLRDMGNSYLHPRADRTSRLTLENRQSDARVAVLRLNPTLEAIYLHGREA